MVWRIIELTIWAVVIFAAAMEGLVVHGCRADLDDLLDDNTRLHERLDRLQYEWDCAVETEEIPITADMDVQRPDPATTSILAIDAEKYGRHAG